MRIKIISVGKIRQNFIHEGEAEYLKRLNQWTKLEMIELGAQAAEGLPAAEARKEEGAKVIARVKPDDYFIVLDERGQVTSSESFSKTIAARMASGTLNIAFAIGGAYGWSEEVRDRADLLMSLSSLTFPFQLTRLILVEQIYRAFTLLNGIPYHK